MSKNDELKWMTERLSWRYICNRAAFSLNLDQVTEFFTEIANFN